MEVSGLNKRSDVGKPSAEKPQKICLTCFDRHGTVIDAGGFCVTCNEFLCTPCYNIHTSPRPMQNHQLLDKRHMPENPLPQAERCLKHTDTPLEYFCSTHKLLACTLCIRTIHKRCSNVDHILDICDSTQSIKELNITKKKLYELDTDVDTNAVTITNNTKDFNKAKDKMISDYKEFQKKMIEHIEKMGNEIKSKIQKLTSHDEALLQTNAVENDSVKSDIKQFVKEFETNEQFQRHIQLFTLMKRAAKKLPQLGKRLEHLKGQLTFKEKHFVQDPKLQEVLEESDCLGQIVPLPSLEQYPLAWYKTGNEEYPTAGDGGKTYEARDKEFRFKTRDSRNKDLGFQSWDKECTKQKCALERTLSSPDMRLEGSPLHERRKVNRSLSKHSLSSDEDSLFGTGKFERVRSVHSSKDLFGEGKYSGSKTIEPKYGLFGMLKRKPRRKSKTEK